MTRIATPALLLAVHLAPGLAAQGNEPGPWMQETEPEAIEKAYRRKAPYNQIDFVRYDKAPFVFFIQKQAPDQTVDKLAYLGASRYAFFVAIDDLFTKLFAKPLALVRNPRPMPYWILKDRETYTGKFGGPWFSGAFFSLVQEHVVVYEDKTRNTYETIGTAMHETVHQIMFSYFDPKEQLQAKLTSGWVAEGMAEYLSSRPHEPLLQGKDPGFGWFDVKRIRSLTSSLRRPFNWRKRSKVEWFHHPMLVMHYGSLQEYLQAAGVGLGTGADQADTSSQIGTFYSSAYAVVSFLMRGYKGHYHDKFLQIVGLEYGRDLDGSRMLAPKHGIQAVRAVFSEEELAALTVRFAEFVADPERIAETDMPEGGDRAVAAITGSGAALFEDEGAAALPELKAADEEVPVLVDLGRILGHYRGFRYGPARKLMEDIDDPVATELRKDIEAMEALLGDFGAKVADKPGRMRLTVSIGGSKPLSWQVMEYRELERSFVVKRGKESSSIPLAELEASSFAESCFRYGLAKDEAQRRALGLAMALERPTITDDKDLRSFDKLVDKEGLPRDFPFLAELAPMARAEAILRKARTEAKITRDGEALLEQLSRSLGALPRSSQLEWMVRNDLPDILDDVFLKSAGWTDRLKGKVTISGDRARIEYDWSSPSQAMDWLLVDVDKERFGVPGDLYGTPQKPERPTEVKVDTQAKELRIFGDGFLRHRLQFEGDVAIEFQWIMDKRETAEGTQATPTRFLVLLDALRPSTFLGADFIPAGASPGIKAVLDGKSRSKGNFKQDDLTKALQASFQDKPLRFERKGDRGLLSADGIELLSCKADKLPDRGAVILGSLHSAVLGDAKAPNFRIGKVVVEGRPCDQSLASSKAGFLHKWASRFPGLQ